jgi:anti-sigma factor RsiW
MTGAHSRELVDALLDGELTPEEAADARAHLTACAECRAHFDARKTLSRAISEAPRFEAPDVLRARIRSLSAIVPDAGAPLAASPPRGWRRAIIAAAVVIVTSGLGALALQSRTSMSDQVLASHLRSLMPGHLTDVQSTDQHNVKPWFNGRVDIAPDVPNLDSAGFPLLGGRVDYVGRKAAAVVVYERRKHVINVFNWAEAGSDRAATEETKNGFHLIRLRRAGIAEWIVSDLNLRELEEFQRLYDR